MNRFGTVILVLAAASILGAAPPDALPPAPAFNIVIDVHPTSMETYQLLRRPTPWTYTCSAVVTTFPADRRIQTRAFLNAEPGKPETITQAFGDDYSMKFTVTVSSTKPEATAVVEVSRAGQPVARQESRVMLQKPEPTLKPAR